MLSRAVAIMNVEVQNSAGAARRSYLQSGIRPNSVNACRACSGAKACGGGDLVPETASRLNVSHLAWKPTERVRGVARTIAGLGGYFDAHVLDTVAERRHIGAKSITD